MQVDLVDQDSFRILVSELYSQNNFAVCEVGGPSTILEFLIRLHLMISDFVQNFRCSSLYIDTVFFYCMPDVMQENNPEIRSMIYFLTDVNAMKTAVEGTGSSIDHPTIPLFHHSTVPLFHSTVPHSTESIHPEKSADSFCKPDSEKNSVSEDSSFRLL